MKQAFTIEQIALKDAVHIGIMSLGGITAAAKLVRVDKGRLSKYASLNWPEFAPVDVCLALDKAAGTRTILGALATLLNCDVAERGACASLDVKTLSCDISKVSGTVVADAINLLDKPNASPNDGRALKAEEIRLETDVRDLQLATDEFVHQAAA